MYVKQSTLQVQGSIKLELLKKCQTFKPSPLEIGLFSATGIYIVYHLHHDCWNIGHHNHHRPHLHHQHQSSPSSSSTSPSPSSQSQEWSAWPPLSIWSPPPSPSSPVDSLLRPTLMPIVNMDRYIAQLIFGQIYIVMDICKLILDIAFSFLSSDIEYLCSYLQTYLKNPWHMYDSWINIHGHLTNMTSHINALLVQQKWTHFVSGGAITTLH